MSVGLFPVATRPVALGPAVVTAGGGVNGSLNQTLGAASVASSSTVAIAGALAKTLGVLASTGSGAVSIAGSASVTLSAATLSADGTNGSAGVNGSLSSTLGAATGAASGATSVTGIGAATLGAVSLASDGSLSIIGALSQALGALTLSASDAEPVVAPPGGGGGVSGGAGSLREVRAFADLLSKRPTKAAKKRLRRVLEAEALELLPDEPEAIKAAQIIAQVVAKKELQAIERRPADAAPLKQLPFDPSAMIRRMVEEWERNEAIRRELEDEFEAEMLLMD